MKKVLIIAVVILAVVIGGISGYIITNANSLAKKFKPNLEKVASNAIKSNVSLGDLSVSLFPSAKIGVDQVKVIPTGEKAEGLTLNNLALHIELLPLLTGKLSITELSLEKPSLTIIKDKDGVYLEGFPKPESKKKSKAQEAKPVKEEKTAKEGKKADPLPDALGLNLENFRIRGASITFKDLIADKEYKIAPLSVSSSVSMEANQVVLPALTVKARLLDKADLKLTSTSLSYNLGSGVLKVPALAAGINNSMIKVEAEVDSSKPSGSFKILSDDLSLGSVLPLIAEFAPAIADLKPTIALKPDFKGSFGAKGNFDVTGKLGLSKMGLVSGKHTISDGGGTVLVSATEKLQKVETSDIALKLNEHPITVAFKVSSDGKKAQLSDLEVSAFSGKLSGQSEIELSEDKKLISEIDLAGINLEQVLSAAVPGSPAKITGTLQSVKSTLSGSLNGESADMIKSLTGQTSVIMKDGSLKEINIGGKVLRSVNDIPFISGSLYQSVPPEKGKEVEKEETKIESLTGNFVVKSGQLSTNNFLLVSSFFSLTGSGVIPFYPALSVNLKNDIIFNKEFSASMAEKTEKVNHLLDSKGRLVVPLVIKGTPPKLAVIPNVQKLIEQGAKRTIEKKAKGFLENLGGKKKGLGGMFKF